MTVHLQADDAGIGEQATRMILDAWKQGLINGFGIVANKECSNQIEQVIKKDPDMPCTISAHLNLTDGMALRSYTAGAYIMNSKGRLKISFVKAFFLLLKGGAAKQQFLQEVYDEWEQQIVFIKQLCGERKLMCINGHNHIHMLPSLFSIAALLAAKHEVPHIRIINEHLLFAKKSDLLRPFFLLNVCKWVVLTICRYQIKRKQIKYSPLTDEVFGVTYSGHITTDAIIMAVKRARKRSVCSLEIILHPGQSLPQEMDKWASTASGKLFFIHPARLKEMEVLEQLKFEHVIENKHN